MFSEAYNGDKQKQDFLFISIKAFALMFELYIFISAVGRDGNVWNLTGKHFKAF